MNDKENDTNSLTRTEQLKLEGYKALNQYGCQMSQDHLSVDRIFMPLLLVPAFLVLTSEDVQKAGKLEASLILGAGVLLLVFWTLRNWRSKKRLYAIWDILPSIERQLKFAAHRTLRKCMKKRPRSRFWLLRRLPPRDFALKFAFAGIAALLYGFVFFLVLSGKYCPGN